MAKRAAKPKLTEAAFQKQVIEAARLLGWKCAHFRGVCVQRANGTTYWQTPVQADGAGFVDLVLVKPHRRIIFAELKTNAGKLTPEQEAWIEALQYAGGLVYVWKPDDWPAIEEALRT